MDYLKDVDYTSPDFGDYYDELPLWSAPFGLLLLEHVPLPSAGTILDVGAGTGFLAIELAQRCGEGAQVIAVDLWEAAIVRLDRKLAYLPGWKSVAAGEAVEATFALLESRLNRVAADRGELSLSIPAACIEARKPAAG